MNLTKLEVQKRVLKGGKVIGLDEFMWDEETRTFSSRLDSLVLDFSNVEDCTFKTGSNCTFKTSSNCNFDTGSYCTFDTSSNCTFKTSSNCNFDTGSYCTFDTSSNCTFDTISNCTFKTGSYCKFNTSSDCNFRTGHNCNFETDSNCTFNTSSYCTFRTGYNCSFNTGSNCVVIRRDIFEIIPLTKEFNQIKINPHGVKGYLDEEGYINGDSSLGKHIIADGILSKIISKKGNVYKVVNHGEEKESYIIQDEDLFAHGDTIKEAKEDLRYKIGNINTDVYKELTLDSIVTLDYAIKMYRAITGACAKGTRYFVENLKNVKEEYSVQEIMDITNGQYGSNKLVEFFNNVREN